MSKTTKVSTIKEYRRSTIGQTHLVVLKTVMSKGGGVFASDIVPVFDAIYPQNKTNEAHVSSIVKRLTSSGYLLAEERPQKDRIGRVRNRKFYTITPLALEAVELMEQRSRALEDALGDIE